MLRKNKWVAILGVTVMALGLLFGTAMADPGDEGENGWTMHEQMDPAHYGQMIQHMTEVHGAEFTAEMVQRMNDGGHCHQSGQDMMEGGMMQGMMGDFHSDGGGMMGHGFVGTANGFMRGVHGMMDGGNGAGMMGR